jgi:hypothetical protein
MVGRWLTVWTAVAALPHVTGCTSKVRDVSPADIDPRSPRDVAAIAETLSAVERSSGEARYAARMKFLDAGGIWLRPTAREVALLPRFEALLDSRDDDDVWLGVVLVGGVGHPSSLPKLWSVVNAPSRHQALRAQAISTIAASYRDPKLVPVLRDMIDHADSPPPEAIRSLRNYVSDPTVVSYLRQLLKHPKHVMLASEVLQQSSIAFDPQEAAVAQMTYSRWADGISIDCPQDWPDEDLDGYSKVFRNQRIGAYYGYRVMRLKRPTKAAALRDDLARRERLHNELSREQGAPAPSIWSKTGATDVAEGRYVVRRDGNELLRRAVFLVQGTRGIVVAGEAPKQGAPQFEAVFDHMWPTIRIHAPDPESAAALTKAINDGLQRTLDYNATHVRDR